MNRLLLACAMLVLSSAALCAQQSSQQDPYSGVSKPPANDTIVTTSAPPAKPAPGQPMNAVPAAAPAQGTTAAEPAQSQSAPGQSQDEAQPGSSEMNANPPMGANGDATVTPPAEPTLEQRDYASDPDGDIVHPEPLQPGEIAGGTTIRVELLDRLSTSESEQGEPFRSRVATDVLEGGQILIPAGAEIDGTVVQVSRGHAGGSGSMRLLPETVILADGTRYRLHAEVTGAPDSNTHVVGEGTIKPDSRWRRDSFEYGGAVGAGAVTGAVLAGPAGALTGGLIGAGAITIHLLRDHPQATLEPGTTLLFTLTDPLFMSAPNASGN